VEHSSAPLGTGADAGTRADVRKCIYSKAEPTTFSCFDSLVSLFGRLPPSNKFRHCTAINLQSAAATHIAVVFYRQSHTLIRKPFVPYRQR